MCTKEFCNAYTELNDPFEQRLRFEEQVCPPSMHYDCERLSNSLPSPHQMRQKDQGDEEAQGVDETFVDAYVFFLSALGV